jgi:hypothetical protein
VKKGKNKIIQRKKSKGSGIRFSPYLVSADDSLHAGEQKPLFDRLDRKHITDGQVSGEGFIEIDFAGCEALELVEGSQHDLMLHHGWDRVKPSVQSSGRSENRAGKRYAAGGVRVLVKSIGLFNWSELKRACLLDFSVNGVGLAFSKGFGVNKKVLLRLEFPDGATFEMEGLVVRSEASQVAKMGKFSGVSLNDSSQSYRDRVLEEGLHRKLR